MGVLAIGVVVLIVTVIAFLGMLPRGGKKHRFVGTELEPYIGVAFTAAIALGLTMTLSGVLDWIGTK